jgi:hypothetical protein
MNVTVAGGLMTGIARSFGHLLGTALFWAVLALVIVVLIKFAFRKR